MTFKADSLTVARSFSDDPFGNLQKAVPSGGTGISFLPGYSASSNRFTSIPGGTPTYDNNGNLTYDVAHHYTWDADSHAISVDGTTITYDALGRATETSFPGYVQSVYGPTGKLALMLGTSLGEARVRLPGGAWARYDSSGLSEYWHPDWLGSSRLETSTSRTVNVDAAFAPYGEIYTHTNNFDYTFTGNEFTDTVKDLNDFLFRKYSPVQGRWISPDPAGLAAVDMTNPQTWNRYAYVENQPCSLIDPFGLSDCTLDIALVGNNLLSSEQLVDAALRINSILGPAGVNVAFSRKNPDFTANFLAQGPVGVFGQTPVTFWGGAPGTGFFSPGDTANIYINNISNEVNGQNVGFATGEVVSHEFTHFLFGSRFAGESYDVNDIMAEGGDAAKMLNPNVGFSSGDLQRVHGLCEKLHPTGRGGGGGGGGGVGGGGFSNPGPGALGTFIGSFGPVEIVTHEIQYK